MEKPSIRWILSSLWQGNIVTPKEALEILEEHSYLPASLSAEDRESLLELLIDVRRKKSTVNQALKELKGLMAA